MKSLADHITKKKPIIKSHLATSTWRSELSKLNIIAREVGHWKLHQITEDEVIVWLTKTRKDLQKKNSKNIIWSPKTRNAYLSIFRKLLDYAVEDTLIKSSPLCDVESSKVDNIKPFPFKKNEIHRIVTCNEFCEQSRILFALGVTTGLSVSELIALAWEDIDYHKKVLRVRRVKPLAKESYKVPGNQVSYRTVELNKVAIVALRRAEVFTGSCKQKNIKIVQKNNFSVKKVYVKFIFHNSFSGKPFTSPKQYAKLFLTPVLKHLQIEHRGAKQMRYTCMYQMFNSGACKDWIRKQFGYTNLEMIDKHHAMFLEEEVTGCTEGIELNMSQVVELEDNKCRDNKESIKLVEPFVVNQPKVSTFRCLMLQLIKLFRFGKKEAVIKSV